MPQQVRVGWRPYVDSGLDVSATAFINAAGLTDAIQKSAVNTLVKDLKRYGLWSKIKAFYPFVGGTATSHKWNLVDPRDTNDAYRLTFSGGWTHDSMGIKSNGSNTSADTYLNLRTVFGATSKEHNLGIYINDNPVGTYGVRGFRSDISSSDATSAINQFVNSATLMFFIGIPSHQWFSFYVAPQSVTGLNEFKRYTNSYYCWFKDGIEISNARALDITTYSNPNANVLIGSSSSSNRYSSSYISNTLNTMESYLMYIAVQRFNSTLSRQSGTAIPNFIFNTYTGTTPSLVTNGLKINIDAQNQTQPNERSLTSNTPGLYYVENDILTDSSGNGNNGTVIRLNIYDGQNRFIEYNKTDLGIPELRFRNSDNTAGLGKLYQSGTSPDYLQTLYKGSDTGTFTVGGWFKVSATHNGFYAITRGHDAYSGGWSFLISMSIGSKFTINLVPTSGSISGTFQSTTIVKSDVWYNVYVVWKPNSYVKMYVNGLLQATNTMTCLGFRSSNAGWGVNSLTAGGSSRGILGAMHVYDRELTDTEVLQNFDAQKSRYNITSVDDTDANAFITAAGITSTIQASAVNTLVTSLKSAGVWTKMKAIYPFVGGTADSHKFNLKDPRDADAAFRLVFNGGWTHTSTGALPNGTTGYADTKFNEYTHITVYDTQLSNYTHLSVYSRTNAASISTYGGIGVDNSYSGWGSLYLDIKRADGLSFGVSRKNINTPPVTMTDSRGFFMINRQSNSTLKYTKDGVVIGQDTTGWSIYGQPGGSRSNVWLGAMFSDYGSGSYQYDNKEEAFASIGYGLTDAETTSLYTAVQTFQTALGRQV